ncbi:hypothetical protein SETIT_5G216100v2 [Setaria italica]|uniref:Leucine-rich repeat-containing N-terminal plant-type domain-containing protein n=1 Tax=Setaria italica TaxID=4555 RepID=A0A368R7G1_SETIT|nr:hypothetical protein SETIT_5G216100v2 [Setaria italica]
MGPQFPAWLRYQTGISNLNISNTRINDVLPQWFWVVFSNASILNLSKNQLSGALPATLELPLIREMDLSGNSLLGQLPVNLTAPGLRKLRLYNNHFTGAIPPYMCNNSFVEINLSNNQLGGDFPRCQESISSLSMLALKNNNLSGEFPHFLQNAAQLSFLDLSYNKFYGSVPSWIGRKMPGLQVLILRSNMFQGQLPKQSTRLVRLHFLDIAHNNISGRIPSSLAGLKAMTHPYGRGDNNYSSDTTSMFTKDRELNYTHKFMKRIMLIDLSCNGFTGHIPKEISLLKGLQSLNLSNNQISGRIPDDIGVLSELESLDLSYNHFTGEIPSSLSDLTFLSCLNLSYNDLSGRIPSGQQLQTLNNQYMYIGNPGLCGPPLLNNCSTNQTDLDVHQERESTIYDTLFFYLSISSGYLIGLWTVFCTLLFKKTWRIAYFRHFDQLYNKIYVQAALSKAECEVYPASLPHGQHGRANTATASHSLPPPFPSPRRRSSQPPKVQAAHNGVAFFSSFVSRRARPPRSSKGRPVAVPASVATVKVVARGGGSSALEARFNIAAEVWVSGAARGSSTRARSSYVFNGSGVVSRLGGLCKVCQRCRGGAVGTPGAGAR